MDQDWPIAQLDPVRRLRVMAGAVHAAFADAVTPRPPGEVWDVVSDFEHELPLLLPDVRTARLRGERVLAVGYLGQRALFDVELDSGWCWMQSRFLVCGFAVAEEDAGTRYAFLGGFRSAAARSAVHLVPGSGGGAYARLITRRIERRLQARDGG